MLFVVVLVIAGSTAQNVQHQNPDDYGKNPGDQRNGAVVSNDGYYPSYTYGQNKDERPYAETQVYRAYGDYLVPPGAFRYRQRTRSPITSRRSQARRNQYDGQDLPNPDYNGGYSTGGFSPPRHGGPYQTQGSGQYNVPFRPANSPPRYTNSLPGTDGYAGRYGATSPEYPAASAYPQYTRNGRRFPGTEEQPLGLEDRFRNAGGHAQGGPNHVIGSPGRPGVRSGSIEDGEQQLVDPSRNEGDRDAKRAGGSVDFNTLLRKYGLLSQGSQKLDMKAIEKLLGQNKVFHGRSFKPSNIDLGAIYTRDSNSGLSKLISSDGRFQYRGGGNGQTDVASGRYPQVPGQTGYTPRNPQMPYYYGNGSPRQPPYFELPRGPRRPTLYPQGSNSNPAMSRMPQFPYPQQTTNPSSGESPKENVLTNLQNGVPLTAGQITQLFGSSAINTYGGNSRNQQGQRGVILTPTQVEQVFGQRGGEGMSQKQNEGNQHGGTRPPIGANGSAAQKRPRTGAGDIQIPDGGIVLTQEQVQQIFGQQTRTPRREGSQGRGGQLPGRSGRGSRGNQRPPFEGGNYFPYRPNRGGGYNQDNNPNRGDNQYQPTGNGSGNKYVTITDGGLNKYQPVRNGGYKPYQPIRNGGYDQYQPIRDGGHMQYQPVRDGRYNQYPPIRDGGYKQYQPVRDGRYNQYPPIRDGGYKQYQPVRDGRYNQYPPIRESDDNQNRPIRGDNQNRNFRDDQSDATNKAIKHDYTDNMYPGKDDNSGSVYPGKDDNSGSVYPGKDDYSNMMNTPVKDDISEQK